MAEFQGVEGIEYDTDLAGDFSDLIAPPYDVINPALAKSLRDKNPHNVVRIILPEAEAPADRYETAGRLVADWIKSGILVRSERAFYVIEQRFEVEKRQMVRTAVLGRTRLAPWGENGVYPHEVTLPRPKADRLKLYRATGLQPGPVFALFEDKAGRVGDILRRVKSSPPWRSGDGPEGARESVWKITDSETICSLTEGCAGESFFVADGHHRYETALAYKRELSAAGSLTADHPANFVLTAAVPFDDEGLLILPTHRLLRLPSRWDAEKALEALAEDYHIESRQALDVESFDAASPEGIGIYAAGTFRLLVMKPQTRRAFRREAGELLADLNVYEVRRKVLTRFFDDVDLAVAAEHITYTHEVADAVAAVDSGDSQVAIILRPLTVRAMAAVAAAGKTMPPKSTYFYPKIPTGVALKPLTHGGREGCGQ